jgi:xanthine dehydrogenase accessory factor
MVAYERLAQLVKQRTPAVLVTVVDARGSTPRKAGARMLVMADGTLEGTVGGGAVEHQARALCVEVLRTRQPRFVEVALGAELGMCCGGTMRLYLEPLLTDTPLVLLGGGHVAQACAQLMVGLGFSVHVADGREGYATPERFPAALQHLDGVEPRDLDALPFGPDAFVLVATHDHQLDQRLVEACLRRPARWLGMVGSQRKALKTRQRCLARGFQLADLERLVCPVGLALGAQTPAEIALSIASEAVAVVRLGALPAQGIPPLRIPLHTPHPMDALLDPHQTDEEGGADKDAPAAGKTG